MCVVLAVVVIDEFPSTWTTMNPTDPPVLIPVQYHSAEYNYVETLFKKTATQTIKQVSVLYIILF